MTKLDKETLVRDLQEFAAELGQTPTRTEMNEEGPHSSTPYYTQWGSWNDALEAAGLGTNHENEISEDRLVEELERLDGELARLPRFEDMEVFGEYSAHTYLRTFGSWGEAKAAAGLSTKRRTSRRIEREELVAAMQEMNITVRSVGYPTMNTSTNMITSFTCTTSSVGKFGLCLSRVPLSVREAIDR